MLVSKGFVTENYAYHFIWSQCVFHRLVSSLLFFFFFDKVDELVGGGSVINREPTLSSFERKGQGLSDSALKKLC